MSPFLPSIFQALGLTLLHTCWQGAIIAGAYAAAVWLTPGARPNTRYVVGMSALLAMLGAAVITFGYELTRLSVETVPVTPEDLATLPGATSSLERWLPSLDALWLFGVAVLSLRMAGGLWLIRRLSAQAQGVPAAIRQRFEAACRRAGLSGRVDVRLNAHIDGPFVVGPFFVDLGRAVVYLPLSAVTALTPEQLDAVFAHELAHVRRSDYAWNLVQSLIETLFFYHPAVWWIGRSLREQRELCCDDVALAACSDPLTYATALLNLEEQRRAPRPEGHLAMALNGEGSGRSLLSRITRILGEAPPKKTPGRPAAFMPLALPVGLLTAAAFLLPMSHVAASPNTTPIPTQVRLVPAVATAEIRPDAAGHDDSAGDTTPATDEAPAPAATDDDVAPDESTWNFVRASAASGQTPKPKPAPYMDANTIARITSDAHQRALEELGRHKADIERAIADATRAQDQARVQALKSIDMVKIQAEIRHAIDETHEQVQVEASLSDADKRKIEAEVARATAEVNADLGKQMKASKNLKIIWAKDGMVPPAPPAPAAAPAPAARPAPAAHPAPPSPPAAPLPVVAVAPVAPVAPITVNVAPVANVKPLTMATVKVATAKVAKHYRIDVKVLNDGNIVRVVSAKGRIATVNVSGPRITTDTRVQVETGTQTATE